MGENDFNPKSTDAMLATILEKLEANGKAVDKHIEGTQHFRRELAQKMDSQEDRVSKVEATVQSLSVRVSSVESGQKKIIAGAGLLAGAGGASGGWLAKIFGN